MNRWDDTTDRRRRDVEPWLVAYTPLEERQPVERDRVTELAARPGYELDPTCVIATDALVVASTLRVGAHSTIASGCVIRGDVRIGAHSSLNAGATTIGRVTIGDWVRIAGTAVLVGENHVFDDPDTPIFVQGLRSEGIVVGDDTWIGAHVTILDGVHIGPHSVVAAGAVVTRDVPAWSVVAGVPARVVRDRRHGAGRPRVGRDELARFAERVADQWPDVLERCRTVEPGGADGYVDAPGRPSSPRALNDAVEIAAAFGAVPPGAGRDELVARIQDHQDPVTGMFVDPRHPPAWWETVRRGEPVDPAMVLAPSDHEWDHYGILSCGYALEALGAAPRHPVRVLEQIEPGALEGLLDRLDWGWLAWPSGAWVDAVGTALMLNRRHHRSTATLPVLWGWLATHVDPRSGMWGAWLAPTGDLEVGWLMAVNGYYRLVRGTYAQFGLEVPRAERAIDTVLAHSRQHDWFSLAGPAGRHRGDGAAGSLLGRTACNVLDVVHPLWLLSRQCPGYRRDEIRDATARVLTEAIADWVDGEGFPWHVGRDHPGLQGTEMWLAVVYLAADVLGASDGLPWRPRGVHRLEPADHLHHPPA